MGICIQLLHGRHTPDEEIDGWGFDGPILGPFPYFHMTYGDDIKLGDEGIIVADKKVELPVADSNGYIKFLGAYYGDMSVVDFSRIANTEFLHRWMKTREILKVPLEKFGLYIEDPEEWVKHYVLSVLKGDKVYE